MAVMPQHTILADGSQAWRLHQELHRCDGPAWIGADGSKAWYINGKHHRTDGPAVIYHNGFQQWWLNGKKHRADGPAETLSNGIQQWWIHGVHMTREINAWMKQKDVTWPWDAETQAEFVLTWL